MSSHEHDAWKWHERADELTLEAEVGLPWAQAAMRWIATLTDAPELVLDVGAGPGVHTVALAEVFPEAQVIAVDENEQLLDRAIARAAEHGLGDRIRAVPASLQGDLSHLPSVDVIWASRVLHHVPDQSATITALNERLTPGGILAVVEGGLPTRFLPEECGVGAPGLQGRLDVAVSSSVQGRLHHDHAGAPGPALDWPVQFSAAGLSPSGSRSFLLDLPAPVSAQVRLWLLRRLARTRDWSADALAPDDLAAVDRLLDSDDTLGLAQRPDLFLLTAVTVHTARREDGSIR